MATAAVKRLGAAIRCALRPTGGLVPGLVSDLTRSRAELLSENALLRQLRNATPFGTGPRFLIRDNDDKFGAEFDRVAEASGIGGLRTPVRAPKANATWERYLGSVTDGRAT